jgi:hypothetical protein
MNKKQKELLDALDARSEALANESGGAGLDWVLMEDAAREIRKLSGQRQFDRLLMNHTTNDINTVCERIENIEAEHTKVMDRLTWIYTLLEADEDVTVEWLHKQIEAIVTGEVEDD